MRCQVSYREKESRNTLRGGEYSCKGHSVILGSEWVRTSSLALVFVSLIFWNILKNSYTLGDREFYSINWCFR